MEAFDFAFTLFGLVLGLAMAEVLGGLVRVLKARSTAPAVRARPIASGSATLGEHIRVGWLTPAIALLVVLDLLSSWMLAWISRGVMPLTFAALLGGTAASALYYIAASLVWPDDPREWPDLDDWFDRHKAQIAGAIAVANVGYFAIQLFNGFEALYLGQELLYIALAVLLTLTRRRWQSGAVMSAMLGLIAVGWF
jgi:hypothetical protein